MVDKIRKFFKTIAKKKKGQMTLEEAVRYSISKYTETYNLLEEYDKSGLQNPEDMADPGRLLPYIREIQKTDGLRRTHPSV